MQNRCKQIREDLGWSRKEMADKMGVEQSTIGNWEVGKRQINIENVMLMSEITGFSILYILGFDEKQIDWAKPLSNASLMTMHRRPVWSKEFGWGLVNVISECLVFADLKTHPLKAIRDPVYAYPPLLECSLFGVEPPLERDELSRHKSVWVEPISSDPELGYKIRGWYHYRGQFVQNEFGIQFYVDTYGVNWLAFESCFPKNIE